MTNLILLAFLAFNSISFKAFAAETSSEKQEYNEYYFRNGKFIGTHASKAGTPSELVELTIGESSLKSGALIYAIEFNYTPHQRIYPISKFELIIQD